MLFVIHSFFLATGDDKARPLRGTKPRRTTRDMKRPAWEGAKPGHVCVLDGQEGRLCQARPFLLQ